jgi:hypothetical protein
MRRQGAQERLQGDDIALAVVQQRDLLRAPVHASPERQGAHFGLLDRREAIEPEPCQRGEQTVARLKPVGVVPELGEQIENAARERPAEREVAA